jgi:hypothetical protein
VSNVEDRIRDAFGAAAGTIQHNNIRGLHDGPGRPPRLATRRGLVPLAAAAAVAVIVVAAAVIVPLVLTDQRLAPGHRPSAAISSPAATPGPRATHVPDAAGLRTVKSAVLEFSLSVPDLWTVTPGMGPDSLAYSGQSGFLVATASDEPAGFRQSCAIFASTNALHPYGSDPKVVYTTVDGRPACLIFPSADAPRSAQREGGPAFQDSTAYIQYLHPVQGFRLLMITADPAHLIALVHSVQLQQ